MDTAYNTKNNGDILMTGVSKSALRWLAASLSLILFAAIVGLSYSIGVGDAEKGAIPIIRADGRSVKVRPENPGGRQYPHQDLVIYNSFRNDIAEKDTYLKESPEKPLILSQKQETTETAPNLDEGSLNLVTVSEETMPTSSLNKPETEDTSIAEIKKIIAQPDPEPVTIAKKEVLAPEKLNIDKSLASQKTKPSIPKGSYLQIGAFRSNADALAALKRAKGKFSVLSASNHFIAKADLGAKGIYYRLRIGPFKSKQAALDTCSKLKAQGQPCLYTAQ